MDEAAAIGIGLIVILIILLPAMIAGIVTLIGTFKVYKKAGEEGWKCLIPYYNTWTECKFIGLNQNWVWITLAAPFIGGVLEGIIEIGLFNLAATVILFYFNILRAVSTAQSFGKDTGFGVGLLVLPFVFYPILGFGKAEYVGPRPMKDLIFKDNNSTSTTNVPQAQPVPQREEDEILDAEPQVEAPKTSGTKFCTNCGAKIESGTNFCTSCGTKLN